MEIKDALEITRDNMRDYGIYVASGRAYPCIKDGLKSSYKRAIYGMYKNNKHQVVKVAELASYALPYHPHPTSISGVIVSLGDNGNKLKLMETQGNWGDSSKDIKPSADRYIGGYLSPLAESLMCDSVEYSNFIKGEIDKEEPEALPTLVPICFINGLSGIPSGLPVLNIPTINVNDIIDYYINILSHKSLSYTPKKLPKPNMELNIISSEEDWENILKTGKGTLKVAPIMDINDGVIKIYSLPGNKNVENVQKILEKEFLQDKIDIRDESTLNTCIVIERVPRKQCDMQEIFERLFKKLQATENYNMAFFDQEKIYVPCSFDKVIKANLAYVIDTHKNRLSKQIKDLENKLKVLEIIEALKTSNIIKKLAEMDHDSAIDFICTKFKCDRDIANKVLQKPLSYLTKEHIQELIDLQANIEELKNDESDIYDFLIKRYKNLKKDIDKVIKNKYLPTNFISESGSIF